MSEREGNQSIEGRQSYLKLNFVGDAMDLMDTTLRWQQQMLAMTQRDELESKKRRKTTCEHRLARLGRREDLRKRLFSYCKHNKTFLIDKHINNKRYMLSFFFCQAEVEELVEGML